MTETVPAGLAGVSSEGGARASARAADAESWRVCFAEAFDASFESVFRYLDRLSCDPDLAADLAQETFVRLYRRGALPDDSRAWLFTVATNLFRNAKNQRGTRGRLLTLARGLRAHSDPAPAPDRAAEGGSGRVRAAMAVLTDRERSLLLLAAEGHSYREIATVLALRETSVGTLLRRAKAAFRAAYGEGSDAP